MSIKLLISDLDGTLLGPDSRITPKTADALSRAHQAGIQLLVATGRSWATASPLLQQAGVVCDFVLLNGAECRTSKGALLCEQSLLLRDARRVVDILQQHQLGFEINTDRGDFSTDTVLCDTAAPMPSLSDFWNSAPRVRKIFAFTQDPMMLEQASQTLSRLPNVTVTSSAPWNLEVTAKEAQKGIMALWAVEQYGLEPHEALVFGDGFNDQSLFRSFPHTRAMGNAAPPLKKIAEQVIEPNTEDGVAQEIDRLLGL